MHAAADAQSPHPVDEVVAAERSIVFETHDVEVPSVNIAIRTVERSAQRQTSKSAVVAAGDCGAAAAHLVGPFKLVQADRRCQVGKIVLIARCNDLIVPPGTPALVTGEHVSVDTVQSHYPNAIG